MSMSPLYGTLGPLGATWRKLVAAGSTLLDGLVSYWPMNETSGTRYDAVGTNHLTDNNTVGAVLRGPEGTVANTVRANSEYLSHAAIPYSTGQRTYAFWFNGGLRVDANQSVFSDDFVEMSLYYATNGQSNLGFSFYDGAWKTGSITTWSDYTNYDTWTHVAVTFVDGGAWQTYLNGLPTVHSGAVTALTASGTPAYPFRICAGYNVGTFEGQTGCFGVWDSALSAGDIAALFASGNGLRYADLSDGLKTGLVSWWELDEVSGVRYDSHGSNDLTDNNTVGAVNSGPKGVVAAHDPNYGEYFSCPWTPTAEWSTVAWFKQDTENGMTLVEWGTVWPSNVNGLQGLDTGGGNLSMRGWQGDGSNYAYAGTSKVGTIGQWTFCGAMYDGAAVYCGLDGQTPASAAADGSSATGAGTLAIGRGLFSGQGVPYGKIASVGVWDRKISQEVFTSLFNSGRGKRYADLTDDEKVGLVSYWNLDEASGVRYDSHGTNHLTDNNTVGSVINAGGAMDGAAASFVAANAEILTSATPVIDTASDWTLALWVRPTGVSTSNGLFSSLSYPQQNHAGLFLEVMYSGNYNRLYNYYGYGTDPLDLGNNTGRWLLILLEYDKATTTMRHRAFGSALNSGVWSAGVVGDLPVMPDIKFGATGPAWSQALIDGNLDEPILWGRRLTDEECAELFAAGRGKYHPFTA